jgi:hypothetical protein
MVQDQGCRLTWAEKKAQKQFLTKAAQRSALMTGLLFGFSPTADSTGLPTALMSSAVVTVKSMVELKAPR